MADPIVVSQIYCNVAFSELYMDILGGYWICLSSSHYKIVNGISMF